MNGLAFVLRRLAYFLLSVTDVIAVLVKLFFHFRVRRNH